MSLSACNRRAPAFESRILCWAGVLLLGGYAFLLAGEFAHGYTLFGHKDLAGHDFSVFWGAGRLAATGHAASVYEWTAIRDLLNAALGRCDYVTTFYYPPWFLLALAPLGSLPFAPAAAIWLAASLAVYLAGLRAILRGGTAMVAALAAPTVLCNVVMGQDGLLTAGLFAGALSLLDAAPIAAGMLIGLIAYKPHFGLLLPLFLAVTGRWRVFASAAATVVAIVALAGALLGGGVLAAFARAIPTAGDAYLRHRGAAAQDWDRLASVYAFYRTLGLNAALAWVGHAAVAGPAAAASLWIAAKRLKPELQAAAIATASLLVTPYSELYDLAILTVAMAFLVAPRVSEGLRRWEGTALAAAFLMPALDIALPLTGRFGHGQFAWLAGPLMGATLAAVISRRVIADPELRERACNPATARIQPTGVSA